MKEGTSLFRRYWRVSCLFISRHSLQCFYCALGESWQHVSSAEADSHYMLNTVYRDIPVCNFRNHMTLFCGSLCLTLLTKESRSQIPASAVFALETLH